MKEREKIYTKITLKFSHNKLNTYIIELVTSTEVT